MCNEGLFFSCHDSYIWRLLILLIAQNWWDWYDFFCSVMEDDLHVSSGTRAFREQPLVNGRQTGQGMASHRWGESAQLPVAIVCLRLTSVASFIYLQNSSIQYQWSWTKLAVHQTIFYPSSYLQVIGRSLAPHHRELGLWIVNYLTGEISSCFNNCSGSVSWQ